MEEYFFGISIATARQISTCKDLVLPANGASDIGEFEFTEDMDYWKAQIQAQADEAAIENYRYACIFSMELLGGLVNELIHEPRFGRVDGPALQMLAALGRDCPFAPAQAGETDILVLQDIQLSANTQAQDAMTQRYLLRCRLQDKNESSLWSRFKAGVKKISFVGGVKGAGDLLLEQ